MSPSSAIGWISIQETKYISFVHFCSRRKRSDYDRVWRRNLRCRAYCDRRTGRPWNLPFPDGKRRAASTPCSDSFLAFPPDVSDLNTRQILLTSPSFYDKNKEDVGGTEGLILTASDVNAPAPRIVHRGLCVVFFSFFSQHVKMTVISLVHFIAPSTGIQIIWLFPTTFRLCCNPAGTIGFHVSHINLQALQCTILYCVLLYVTYIISTWARYRWRRRLRCRAGASRRPALGMTRNGTLKWCCCRLVGPRPVDWWPLRSAELNDAVGINEEKRETMYRPMGH